MKKKIAKRTRKELVEFGQYLNSFHDSSGMTFEIENSKRMKECSLNDVIESFQNFFNGKIDRFKIWITRKDSLGISLQKIEFETKTNRK